MHEHQSEQDMRDCEAVQRLVKAALAGALVVMKLIEGPPCECGETDHGFIAHAVAECARDIVHLAMEAEQMSPRVYGLAVAAAHEAQARCEARGLAMLAAQRATAN